MNLLPEQTKRFYRAWFALLGYTNEQRRLGLDLPARPKPGFISPADADRVRKVLWADDSLRERFVAENPAGLPQADLDVVASWRHRVAGGFFVLRHLQAHTIFLDEGRPTRAYGARGLVSPMDEVVPPPLPAWVDAVLIPFEGAIAHDSLISRRSISFGGGIRRGLNEEYRAAREREGLIASLPPDAAARPSMSRGRGRRRRP
ncbi:MAG: hypothetical protein HY744_28530 [Deltaproteobacteria bacterium]|nr:hypothetical protein [Deltaproteobacteria bacterium]